jgi:hypothetical protein
MICRLRAEFGDLIDNELATAPIGRNHFLGKNLAGQIGNRQTDLRAAEIDSGNIGSIRHEFIGHRRAPDMTAGAAGFAHPVVQLQLADDFGNGLLGESRLL